MKQEFNNEKKRKFTFYLAVSSIIIPVAAVIIFFLWSSSYLDSSKVIPLNQSERQSLETLLNNTYPQNRNEKLKSLPYQTKSASLNVSSGAAILVDCSNGCILYEKNADEIIPPASLTKLFVMYVAFKEIRDGNLSLDEYVQPPESSWAINMPADSSLMFLGQGHKVTVDELLTGLAVASGNDAALALAYKISGSTKAFVDRMNYEVMALGLEKTHFVEPSGYSEKNVTTARELAEFCRIYINTFPESLEKYHSRTEISYPLQKNLPSWQQDKGDSFSVYQKNTNPLLGKMEGCDGLKTGFIYESGYNLALTAQRKNVRFLSVTMKGPGSGSKEGNFYRVKDGTLLMEWAFSSFKDYFPFEHLPPFFTVPVPAGKQKFVNLVPAWENAVTVPVFSENAAEVKAEVSVPRYIFGGTEKGKVYGQIQYKIGEIVLETVPLVADRNVEKSGIWGKFWGSLATYRL